MLFENEIMDMIAGWLLIIVGSGAGIGLLIACLYPFYMDAKDIIERIKFRKVKEEEEA